MKTSKQSKTVSLVLGGGGARGYAHIGIINWLNDNGYQIQSISGSSIGALIGGIYAAGKLDVYSSWVKSLEKTNVIGLLDFSFTQQGLFKGERIIKILKEMIGDHNIEELPISFTAVATDIKEQKEVWINHGSLFDAVRASIAIPMIFTPHKYMGMLLVDGSVVNPVPIAPTLNDITDITIAVDPNGPPDHKFDKKEPEKKISSNKSVGYSYLRITNFFNRTQSKSEQAQIESMSLYDLISNTSEAMLSRITRLQLAAYTPDIVISIPRNSCSFYEFYRAEEMIDFGYANAEKYLSQ